jgi:hypothetical protein
MILEPPSLARHGETNTKQNRNITIIHLFISITSPFVRSGFILGNTTNLWLELDFVNPSCNKVLIVSGMPRETEHPAYIPLPLVPFSRLVHACIHLSASCDDDGGKSSISVVLSPFSTNAKA